MYTYNHMENIFEIGRDIEFLMRVEDFRPWCDSKDMFMDAMKWAIEFEDKYEDNGDYYRDIDAFIRKKFDQKVRERLEEGLW